MITQPSVAAAAAAATNDGTSVVQLMTPTQLRNARKRRAKQKLKQKQQQQHQMELLPTKGGGSSLSQQARHDRDHHHHQDDHIPHGRDKDKDNDDDDENPIYGTDTGIMQRPVKRRRHSQQRQQQQQDPSTVYLSNPCHAPMVRRARAFFAQHYHQLEHCHHRNRLRRRRHVYHDDDDDDDNAATTRPPSDVTDGDGGIDSCFPIVLGPTCGWRTVAKLAVRYRRAIVVTNKNEPSSLLSSSLSSSSSNTPTKSLLTLGLFAPHSHTIIPLSNSPVHHPSINRAARALQSMARTLQIVPYNECTGEGHWRYVTLAVQRSTGAVQVTLVWNDVDQDVDHDVDHVAAIRLDKSEKKDNNNNAMSSCQQSSLDRFCQALVDQFGLVHVNELAARRVDPSHDGDNYINNNNKEHFTMHSLWVHYNSAWKHSNAIYSYQVNDPMASNLNNNKNINTNHNSKKHGTWELRYGLNAIVEYLDLPQSLPLQPPLGLTDCDKHNNIDNSKHSRQPRERQHHDSANRHSQNSRSRNMKSNKVEGSKEMCVRQQDHHYHHHPVLLMQESTQPRQQQQLLLPTVPLYFPPNVFRQANLDGFTTIVDRIVQYLQCQFGGAGNGRGLVDIDHDDDDDDHRRHRRPHCVELYGGVGTIGLHLIASQSIASLTCSDENPHNVSCFARSVSAMMDSSQQQQQQEHHQQQQQGHCRQQQQSTVAFSSADKTIQYHSLSAAAMVESGILQQPTKAQLVIVDPPRGGLESTVLHALCATHCVTETLVYVSCGFDSFQRDCLQLMAKPEQQKNGVSVGGSGGGGYQLELAEGHVLFPGSNAIETLAIFSRQRQFVEKSNKTFNKMRAKRKS